MPKAPCQKHAFSECMLHVQKRKQHQCPTASSFCLFLVFFSRRRGRLFEERRHTADIAIGSVLLPVSSQLLPTPMAGRERRRHRDRRREKERRERAVKNSTACTQKVPVCPQTGRTGMRGKQRGKRAVCKMFQVCEEKKKQRKA